MPKGGCISALPAPITAPSQAAVLRSNPSRTEIDGSSAETPLSISPAIAATHTSGSAKRRHSGTAGGAGRGEPGSWTMMSSWAAGAGCPRSRTQASVAQTMEASASHKGDLSSTSASGSSAGPATIARPTEVSNRPTNNPRWAGGAISASQASPATHTSPPPRPSTSTPASQPR